MSPQILPHPWFTKSTDKAAWRAQARKARTALFEQSLLFTTLCQRLQENLIRSTLWAESSQVLLYVSIKEEVDTSFLLHTAWAQNKRVYLPRCEPDKPGEMTMRVCTQLSELCPSRMGILEPAPDAPRFVEQPHPPHADFLPLVVVPGLVFDQHGYRIGYGGGYYDRLLSRCPMRSVGLAFQQHIVPQLPCDPWDVPMTALCSEEGLCMVKTSA